MSESVRPSARRTSGRLVSIEIDSHRQAEARRTLEDPGSAELVEFVLADESTVLDRYDGLEFVLIDCEKEDYVRFFDVLRLSPGAVIVADNILSHDLWDDARHVRSRAEVESVTLPIGRGLEVSRVSGGRIGPTS